MLSVIKVHAHSEAIFVKEGGVDSVFNNQRAEICGSEVVFVDLVEVKVIHDCCAVKGDSYNFSVWFRGGGGSDYVALVVVNLSVNSGDKCVVNADAVVFGDA